jgi:hypothetical protein
MKVRPEVLKESGQDLTEMDIPAKVRVEEIVEEEKKGSKGRAGQKKRSPRKVQK